MQTLTQVGSGHVQMTSRNVPGPVTSWLITRRLPLFPTGVRVKLWDPEAPGLVLGGCQQARWQEERGGLFSQWAGPL